MLTRKLFGAVVCATLLAGSSSCFGTMILGDPVPLDSLELGGEITVGDKTFTEFSYAKTEDMPDSDAVNVIPIRDDLGNYGLRFQGGFADIAGGSSSDALITFTVTSQGADITDVHLAGNPNLNGPGLAEVTETFLPDSTSLKLNIYDNGEVSSLADWADLANPVRTLHVQKDILLRSDDGGVSATLSFVDQTFSQVPEPAGVSLLLLGLIGLIARRR
jgi:hypothetical protein